MTLFALCWLLASGCTKLVEVDPPVTQRGAENVYNNDEAANAVVNSIYTRMSTAGTDAMPFFMSIGGGLLADEFTLYASDYTLSPYYQNNLLLGNSPQQWSQLYNYIFTVNAVLQGVAASSSLSEAVKEQLTGQAKFLRAYCYFYLVNLYGDVPLVLGTDYKTNTLLPREAKDKVYQQMVADLKDAESLLSAGYVKADAKTPTDERTVPVKWTAAGLLARVYLYTEQYQLADDYASKVIGQSSLYGLDSLHKVFLKNSREAMWQLQPVSYGVNTLDGATFIIPSTGPSGANPVYLTDDVLASFYAGDARKVKWVDSVVAAGVTYKFPAKYKSFKFEAPVTEYQMLMRLAEQYLIRAEARLGHNDLEGAVSDINIIRHRAQLPDYAGVQDAGSLKAEIMRQRQAEFFSEQGHRWLDLKRTGAVDSVMSRVTPLKRGVWKTTSQLFPLHPEDLRFGPNLKQNAGY